MRPLIFSINVTLDVCIDDREGIADPELHARAAEKIARADAILFGRVTYQMMEEAWRPDAATGAWPDWMEEWMVPFARTMDAAPKYVVSRSLEQVDWNAELLRGNVCEAVRRLKAEPGKGLFVAGHAFATALAGAGLIDEYEFVVKPRVVGHGPTLFAGLPKALDLRLVGREDYASGAVAMRYVVNNMRSRSQDDPRTKTVLT